MNRYAVIMAGGSGERFFPLSRQRRPKQLLPLLGDGKTLLEHTLVRCSAVVPPEHILIVTSPPLQQPIATLLGSTIPRDNIIAEPAKRNTAGCLTLAAALIGLIEPDALIAAIPADHYISDTDRFAELLAAAFDFARAHETIVTFGMRPMRPETGYGYIELGTSLGNGFYRVASFREKPDTATAALFLERGTFRWNSGMFVYRLDVFERELGTHAPSFGRAIPLLRQAYREGNTQLLAQTFGELPNISIDYALMERTTAIAVLEADFAWDDLGAWDAVRRIIPPDSSGTVTIGNVLSLDTSTATLANYAERQMLLCALGVRDIVAVVTDDVVMLCPADRVQEVRRIVEHLRANGMDQWL